MAFLDELKQHLPMMAMMGGAAMAPQSSGVAQQGLQALMQSDKMGLLKSKLEREEAEVTSKAELDKQVELAFKYLIQNRESGRDKNELMGELQGIAPALFQSKEGMQRFGEAWNMIMGQKEEKEKLAESRHYDLLKDPKFMTGEQLYPGGGYIPEGTGGMTVKGTTFYPTPKMGFAEKETYKAGLKKPPKTVAQIKAEAKAKAEGKILGGGGKLKKSQNYLLGDQSIVTSFDGGRTYIAEDRKKHPMPSNAMKISAQITGQDLSMIRAQEQARKEGKQILPSDRSKTVEDAAKKGTGPYSMLAATIDNLFGGMGADLLFGKNSLFPDTQENRQLLRTIKQVGKAALMNSSRGAIWEQEKIDKLFPDPDKIFVNPRTEARKFKTLRKTLLIEKIFNNKAIKAAVSPKEVSSLRNSNAEIDRLLALIGQGGAPVGGLSKEDETLINKYLK